MNRKQIVDRIAGPTRLPDQSYTWVFEWRRPIRHRSETVTVRRFFLDYDYVSRRFSCDCTRRVSKRKKRVRVKVARHLVDFLRTRLPPKDIAECMAASIKAASDPDSQIPL